MASKLALVGPTVVRSDSQLEEVVRRLDDCDDFVFDVETMGPVRLDPWRNEVFWVSVATTDFAAAIPCRHPVGEQIGWDKEPRLCKDGKTRQYKVPKFSSPPSQLWPGEVFGALEPFFFSDRTKVGHNLKFDVGSVAKYYDGRIMPGPYACTHTASVLLNENQRGNAGGGFPYSLGACVYRNFRYKYDKTVGKEVEKHPFSVAGKYSYRDAKWDWLLWRAVEPMIYANRLDGLWNLEMDILGVLLHMEQHGAPIDWEQLQYLDKKYRAELDSLEGDLYRVIGHPINLNSNPQKIQAFYKGQKLKPKKFTAGGQPSCDAEALEHYKSNPVIGAYLEYADVSKLWGTYINGYLNGPPRAGTTQKEKKPHVGVVNGRIHANFKQVGAKTGRFSCSDPNLQNIPKPETEKGKEIRGLFIAEPGSKLIVADWSQIEYRLMAMFCGDKRLIEAYMDGADLHQIMADIMKIGRSAAKNCNFAVLYGAGPDKVAAMSHLTVDEAKKIMKDHQRQFPKIYQFADDVVATCRRRRPVPYVQTILGRRRRLPELLSQNYAVRGRNERQAVNAVVQGSAADLNKLAMVRLHHIFQTDPDAADMRILLTVHDEIVSMAPEGQADLCAQLVKDAMEGDEIASLLAPVPLVADIKIVDRWSQAKEAA